MITEVSFLSRDVRMAMVCLLMLAALPICSQTSLPKISLQYSDLDKEEFNPGTFTLDDGQTVQEFTIQIRHRGDLSSRFKKPSYAVKLYDAEGLKADVSLLGLRDDNYWILDAMVIDVGRVRNRVSMDLWLEFARLPWYYEQEPKMINGYRGEMVELYVNDSFQGLYCLNERVDRKQLKLKKYSEKKGIQGVMYKSVANTQSSKFLPTEEDAPTDDMSSWDGWDVKYPDMDEGDPVTWTPLTNFIDFVAKSKRTDFSNGIGEYIDMPVAVDYLLFCELLYANDNLHKNMIVSYYNSETQKALLTPWDLDLSWGRDYTGQELNATMFVYNKSRIFSRLVTECKWFFDEMKTRWAELRQTYFTIENIDSHFAHYFDLYAETGIDKREEKLWNRVDNLKVSIGEEKECIHNWTVKRLEYLDEFLEYQPSATGVGAAQAEHSAGRVVKFVKDGKVYFRKEGKTYNMLGVRVD